ncbi:hypothetical protein AABB24_020255 [Solanum stoloniferum]|uniref:Retrovirus-related Pol polyprotein from transposon TNT 1-94-like beta-barrel domain-containing protein n=1 Tax=Solanum stoloniferum TaxID=62892 RepID=A0ABD2T719_9SOLN
MHSRLQNVQVQEDMRGSGQANAPEQWLEMLHKASPKQIKQMRGILQGHNELSDSLSSTNLAGNPNPSLKWIVDTEASDHMIHNHAYLYHKHIIGSKGIVQLPTGDSTTISHIGSLKLNETEMISDVLCIPAFRFNCLSLNKLTKELNYCVSFFPTHCIF